MEKKKKRDTLPERVAQIYYSHALFCSSHPILVISLALVCFLSCCYPLFNYPLPGSTPTRVVVPCAPCTSQATQTHPPTDAEGSIGDSSSSIGNLLCTTLCMNATENVSPPNIAANAFNTPQPLLYVHQLILNTGVWPWNEELRAEDAYRAPLQEVFRLLDIIRNHQDPISGTLLGHVCYHVESVSTKKIWANAPTQENSQSPGVFPEYNCLVLSPANLWHQDLDKFSLDPDPLETIFTHQSLQKGKVSTAEMVFGMHMKETGIKRYPLRSRTRIVQYAVTLFYDKLNVRYVKSLNEKLLAAYPESRQPGAVDYEATLIYYPADFNYYEFIPLCVAFIGLFVYIYFSVKKIEFVKSKVGLAASAVISIAAGLTMSIGICFFFGLTLSFRGKEIFPYLVILVGVENVFVLTKSVMSIDSQLDVKIRLAQGLSKEGWSITKNILIEITILTLCLFTFIPVIQQFSIFMIVSLFSDYFLQMFFFTTVLGIDIKRKEMSRERPSTFQFYGLDKYAHQDFYKYGNKSCYETTTTFGKGKKLPRSKSQPRLDGIYAYSSYPTISSDAALRRSQLEEHRAKLEKNNSQDRVPKRIRLVNVWARTRFFQRAFMIWMVVWVSMIIYSSGFIEDLLIVHQNISTVEKPWKADDGSLSAIPEYHFKPHWCNVSSDCVPGNIRNGMSPTPRHWSALLAHYNVSCAGRHLAVVPSLMLRHHVSAEVAIAARPPPPLHPNPPPRWRAFAAALDPLDFSDMEKEETRWIWKGSGGEEEQPFYPTSLMELFLLSMLCAISVLVISYMMVVLYRCVCTRNYAEWRATWAPNSEMALGVNHQTPQVVMEAVPIVVAGHSQEVECLATDGERVVSICLLGTIKVWDSSTGDLLTNINRAMFFELQNEVFSKLQPDTKETTNVEQHCGDSPENHLVESSVHTKDSKSDKINLLKNFKFTSNPAANSSHDAYELSSISRKTKTIYDFALHYTLMQERERKAEQEGAESSSAGSKSESSSNRSSISEGNVPKQSDKDGYTPIWCMDVCRCWDLVVVGCANGRLEFWAISTGRLECAVESAGASGITHLQIVGELVVVGGLTGNLEIFRTSVMVPSSTVPPPSNRGHMRTGSAGSISLREAPLHVYNRFTQKLEASSPNNGAIEQGSLQCTRVSSVRAHQQPFLALECDSRWVITGSMDHTVKVFWMDDLSPAFTFHGHRSPVRSIFLDGFASVSGSGSEEGLLCVWDLTTGTCVYSVTAHDGPVTTLSVTASYVISLGGDDRLCIWDRFRGHRLNAVSLSGGAGGCGLLSLGPSLVISGGRGGLTLWDASSATALRKVHLGHNDGCTFVKQILRLRDGIVCDYSNQLRIVRFPFLTNPSKCE